MYCIYQEYTRYISGITHSYFKDMHGIYMTYYMIVPGGWCCGPGHGPIAAAPQAIRSPGLVNTVTFFTAATLHRLDLEMWILQTRLSRKKTGSLRCSHDEHTKRSDLVILCKPSTSVLSQHIIPAKRRMQQAYSAMNIHWSRTFCYCICYIPGIS